MASSVPAPPPFGPLRLSSPSPPRLFLLPGRSRSRSLPPLAALRSSRGFGSETRGKQRQQRKRPGSDQKEEKEEEEEGEEEDGMIPEVVTSRMMRRMGVTVGAPLGAGLLCFPAFYYLKAVARVDVPTWIPLGVSFFFFGAALLGVSYGIVSASWDPLREGSLLGWTEARQNWPVFWASLRRRDD